MRLSDIKEYSLNYNKIDGSSCLMLEIPHIKESNMLYCHSEMISKNLSAIIYDLNISIIGNRACLTYGTDGKIALPKLCEIRKLEKHETIMILRNIVRTILRAEKYFLIPYNFLISKETIFVNPDNLEVSLIYVPIEMAGIKDVNNIDCDTDKSILEGIGETLESCCNDYHKLLEEISGELKNTGTPINNSSTSNNSSHSNDSSAINSYICPGEINLKEFLQQLNNMSNQILPVKNIQPGEVNQLKIRYDNKQDGKQNGKQNGKQINKINNHGNILDNSLTQIIKIFIVKNKSLVLSLAALQLAAILIMILLQKPIRDINPDGTGLTYGLFGLILAGLNTLLIRKFVS